MHFRGGGLVRAKPQEGIRYFPTNQTLQEWLNDAATTPSDQLHFKIHFVHPTINT